MAGLYEDNLFLTYLHEFLDLEPKVKETDVLWSGALMRS